MSSSSGSNVVQMVYELSREIFSLPGAAVIPAPEAIHRLTSLLDTVKPMDLGLDEDAKLEIEQHSSSSCPRTGKRRRERRRLRSEHQWTPPVTYVHIHECDNFSMGIFCLPRSAVIPLHDHRGMTVLSKLLYGSMHVRSYDWFDPAISDTDMSSPGLRLAELKPDAVLRAPNCETSVLYPTTGGNIHSFTALTSCAVLDVLVPPYKEDPAYYRVHPYSSRLMREGSKNKGDVDSEGCVWLEEVEKPDNYILRGRAYGGPIIDVI